MNSEHGWWLVDGDPEVLISFYLTCSFCINLFLLSSYFYLYLVTYASPVFSSIRSYMLLSCVILLLAFMHSHSFHYIYS